MLPPSEAVWMLQQACDHQLAAFPRTGQNEAFLRRPLTSNSSGCVVAWPRPMESPGLPGPKRMANRGSETWASLNLLLPAPCHPLVFTSSSFFTDARTPNARKIGKPVHLVVAKCILPFRGYRCFDHPTFPGLKQAPSKGQAHSPVASLHSCSFSCQALPPPPHFSLGTPVPPH
ncbi:hypothetical protein L209DRAFT_598267 [Thermothelomyces heterothallicus CBS 203.75]